MDLIDFLKTAKDDVTYIDAFKEVHIVLGNSACDLDSTVSAILYSYYLSRVTPEETAIPVIPVLNIPRCDYPLRTEITPFLSSHKVQEDLLTFRDSFDLHSLAKDKRLKLTLVDHNVISEEDREVLDPCVVQIIDHHENGRGEEEEGRDLEVQLEPVGSCVTLVAERILSAAEQLMDERIAALATGTILLDTVNLSREAGRTTDKDEAVVDQLQRFCPNIVHQDVFESLQRSKFDVSGLSAMDVVRKDFKSVSLDHTTIGLSSIPCSIEALLQKSEVWDIFPHFAESRNLTALLLLSAYQGADGALERGFGIFSLDGEVRNKLVQHFTSGAAGLQLKGNSQRFINLVHFYQGNTNASRKFILPLAQRFLEHGPEPRPTEVIAPPNTEKQGERTAEGESDSVAGIGTSESKVVETADLLGDFDLGAPSQNNNHSGHALPSSHVGNTNNSNPFTDSGSTPFEEHNELINRSIFIDESDYPASNIVDTNPFSSDSNPFDLDPFAPSSTPAVAQPQSTSGSEDMFSFDPLVSRENGKGDTRVVNGSSQADPSNSAGFPDNFVDHLLLSSSEDPRAPLDTEEDSVTTGGIPNVDNFMDFAHSGNFAAEQVLIVSDEMEDNGPNRGSHCVDDGDSPDNFVDTYLTSSTEANTPPQGMGSSDTADEVSSTITLNNSPGRSPNVPHLDGDEFSGKFEDFHKSRSHDLLEGGAENSEESHKECPDQNGMLATLTPSNSPDLLQSNLRLLDDIQLSRRVEELHESRSQRFAEEGVDPGERGRDNEGSSVWDRGEEVDLLTPSNSPDLLQSSSQQLDAIQLSEKVEELHESRSQRLSEIEIDPGDQEGEFGTSPVWPPVDIVDTLTPDNSPDPLGPRATQLDEVQLSESMEALHQSQIQDLLGFGTQLEAIEENDEESLVEDQDDLVAPLTSSNSQDSLQETTQIQSDIDDLLEKDGIHELRSEIPPREEVCSGDTEEHYKSSPVRNQDVPPLDFSNAEELPQSDISHLDGNRFPDDVGELHESESQSLPNVVGDLDGEVHRGVTPRHTSSMSDPESVDEFGISASSEDAQVMPHDRDEGGYKLESSTYIVKREDTDDAMDIKTPSEEGNEEDEAGSGDILPSTDGDESVSTSNMEQSDEAILVDAEEVERFVQGVLRHSLDSLKQEMALVASEEGDSSTLISSADKHSSLDDDVTDVEKLETTDDHPEVNSAPGTSDDDEETHEDSVTSTDEESYSLNDGPSSEGESDQRVGRGLDIIDEASSSDILSEGQLSGNESDQRSGHEEDATGIVGFMQAGQHSPGDLEADQGLEYVSDYAEKTSNTLDDKQPSGDESVQGEGHKEIGHEGDGNGEASYVLDDRNSLGGSEINRGVEHVGDDVLITSNILDDEQPSGNESDQSEGHGEIGHGGNGNGEASYMLEDEKSLDGSETDRGVEHVGDDVLITSNILDDEQPSEDESDQSEGHGEIGHEGDGNGEASYLLDDRNSLDGSGTDQGVEHVGDDVLITSNTLDDEQPSGDESDQGKGLEEMGHEGDGNGQAGYMLNDKNSLGGSGTDRGVEHVGDDVLITSNILDDEQPSEDESDQNEGHGEIGHEGDGNGEASYLLDDRNSLDGSETDQGVEHVGDDVLITSNTLDDEQPSGDESDQGKWLEEMGHEGDGNGQAGYMLNDKNSLGGSGTDRGVEHVGDYVLSTSNILGDVQPSGDESDQSEGHGEIGHEGDGNGEASYMLDDKNSLVGSGTDRGVEHVGDDVLSTSNILGDEQPSGDESDQEIGHEGEGTEEACYTLDGEHSLVGETDEGVEHVQDDAEKTISIVVDKQLSEDVSDQEGGCEMDDVGMGEEPILGAVIGNTETLAPEAPKLTITGVSDEEFESTDIDENESYSPDASWDEGTELDEIGDDNHQTTISNDEVHNHGIEKNGAFQVEAGGVGDDAPKWMSDHELREDLTILRNEDHTEIGTGMAPKLTITGVSDEELESTSIEENEKYESDVSLDEGEGQDFNEMGESDENSHQAVISNCGVDHHEVDNGSASEVGGGGMSDVDAPGAMSDLETRGRKTEEFSNLSDLDHHESDFSSEYQFNVNESANGITDPFDPERGTLREFQEDNYHGVKEDRPPDVNGVDYHESDFREAYQFDVNESHDRMPGEVASDQESKDSKSSEVSSPGAVDHHEEDYDSDHHFTYSIADGGLNRGDDIGRRDNAGQFDASTNPPRELVHEEIISPIQSDLSESGVDLSPGQEPDAGRKVRPSSLSLSDASVNSNKGAGFAFPHVDTPVVMSPGEGSITSSFSHDGYFVSPDYDDDDDDDDTPTPVSKSLDGDFSMKDYKRLSVDSELALNVSRGWVSTQSMRDALLLTQETEEVTDKTPVSEATLGKGEAAAEGSAPTTSKGAGATAVSSGGTERGEAEGAEEDDMDNISIKITRKDPPMTPPEVGEVAVRGRLDTLLSETSIGDLDYEDDDDEDEADREAKGAHSGAADSPSRKRLSVNLGLGLSDDASITTEVLDAAYPDVMTPTSTDMAWEDDSRGEKTPREPPIPEYTAREEHNDRWRWRLVKINDQEYTIDNHVIEPYKKVLSHGGYYGSNTMNAVIVIASCYLPDKSRLDYEYVMHHLFLYVVSSLELLVAQDYMIVYFHGAAPRSKIPSLGWMKKCYQMIDRRLKKNLKGLYIVHPTPWLKTIMLFTKPFISSKFYRKVKFVHRLGDLASHVTMEYIFVPEEVKKYDDARNAKQRAAKPARELKKTKREEIPSVAGRVRNPSRRRRTNPYPEADQSFMPSDLDNLSDIGEEGPDSGSSSRGVSFSGSLGFFEDDFLAYAESHQPCSIEEYLMQQRDLFEKLRAETEEEYDLDAPLS